MKIKSIILHHIQLPLNFEFKTAQSQLDVRDTIIIECIDDKGGHGYGECVSFTTPFYTEETLDDSWQALAHDYIPKVLATQLKHPFDIHQLINELLPMAMAGLENSLLDLYYKNLEQPIIASLFDEKLNSTIKQGSVISDVTLDQTLLQVDKLIDNGVRRIKLKINPTNAFEKVKTVTEKFPHITFAVDANRSYELNQIDSLLQLDNLGLACIEEPFNTYNLEDYSKILSQFNTPICFDENVQTMNDLEKLIKLNGKKVLNIKIGRLGGLYYAEKAIELCRQHDIEYWIGSMVESGISKILHIQLASLPDTYIAGDLSSSSHYFKEDLISPEITFAHGQMTLPTGIGLGVEINTIALEKYTIKKEIFQ
ncbi:MAG: o-succinylbenzoate synthase [Streptococcaceae bacterium]|nr:o-succinylbenzoate synthase [Streptococcaceae bacterium]MCL2681036.1 o-succinylbenzoate synthase [Streptococcaceae bacterium]MCL2858332.1 o-succinylbenzoate synthase [Streptococcaceae bacterium]